MAASPAAPAPAAPGLSRKATLWLIAFFAVSAAGFFAAATWSYLDEHSGPAGTATVTRCESVGGRIGRGRDLQCTGRWTQDGRQRTGAVFNAERGDIGKTLPVRFHGDHASRPAIGISIACAVAGAFMVGVIVILLVELRRRSRREPGLT